MDRAKFSSDVDNYGNIFIIIAAVNTIKSGCRLDARNVPKICRSVRMPLIRP